MRGYRSLWSPLISATASKSISNDADTSTWFVQRAIPNGADTSATTSSLLFFPLSFYPHFGCNQIVLRWNLITLPTAGTYVQLTPFGFETFFSNATSQPEIIGPGYPISTPTITPAIALQQFDQYNNAAGTVTPHNYSIRRTVVDRANTLGGLAFPQGTQHLIPIASDYVGFYCETDGNDDTGSMTLFAQLRWA